MQTNLQISNIHKAYGDDSVYQVIVGYDNHIEDGESMSDWTDCGYVKIRAVKDSNDLYCAVIRASDGELMYESPSTFNHPDNAISLGIEVYMLKFMV